VDINVYLPDDLGQWAKSHGIPLSMTLREAVQRERELQTMLEGSEVCRLYLEDAEGRGYTGKLDAVQLTVEHTNDVEVYLASDRRVLVYDVNRSTLVNVTDNLENLQNWLDWRDYITVMAELGQEAEVDV
jgi:hypothetical protein